MIEKMLLYVLLVFVSHFLLRIILYFGKIKNNGKERVRDRDLILLSALVAFFFFSILIDYGGVGYKIPGSEFETTQEYEREFYVNIFPDRSKGTNYRVPALIHAMNDEGFKIYTIEEATLPSGRTLNFGYTGEDILELNEKEYVIADDGSGWYIELTDKPAP